jgi:hypothetical protein
MLSFLLKKNAKFGDYFYRIYPTELEINGQGGEIFMPDSVLNLKTIQSTFEGLGEKYYSTYHGTLQCGNFKCSVQLFPAPEPYDK